MSAAPRAAQNPWTQRPRVLDAPTNAPVPSAPPAGPAAAEEARAQGAPTAEEDTLPAPLAAEAPAVAEVGPGAAQPSPAPVAFRAAGAPKPRRSRRPQKKEVLGLRLEVDVLERLYSEQARRRRAGMRGWDIALNTIVGDAIKQVYKA